jgi:hypothetical protein
MCRIASIFLLQRLKGSMSAAARDFNNIETRSVIKFFFPLQGKTPKEFHAILTETLGEYAPRRSLLPRRPGWRDNLLDSFSSGLQELEQRAK